MIFAPIDGPEKSSAVTMRQGAIAMTAEQDPDIPPQLRGANGV
jgi:hypothetical protein